MTIPVVDGVSESYFGIIPFNELKKIITDESEQIRNIFYDNVRDFLGDNPVNISISNTLEEKKFGFFGVLNNGVTIVADRLQSTGDQFTINNYQDQVKFNELQRYQLGLSSFRDLYTDQS